MDKLRTNMSFVRLFLGRVITNAGDSLYFIGTMWLIYELTGSSFYTGIAGAIVQLSSSLQFVYGPLVDRWNVRRILIVTQVVQAVAVLAIPIAAAMGRLSVWIVLVVVPVLSFVNEIVYPAQTSVLPRIVDDAQLVRANSLFSTAYRGTEIVFNAAAGLLIAVIGTMSLFVVDAVTFAVAAVLFFGITIPPVADTDADDGPNDYLTDLREGIGYLRGSMMLSMMAGAMVVNVGSGALLAVLPAFADAIGGASTYGFLMAAIAAGPLVGAVTSSLVEDRPYGLVSVVGFVASGLFLFLGLVLQGTVLTALLFFAAFVPVGTFNVIFSSIIQSSVDEAFLGRVSSVLSSVSMTMIPVGTLSAGILAERFSPTTVLYGTATLLLLFGIYFLVHPRLRTLPSVNKTDEGTLGLG